MNDDVDAARASAASIPTAAGTEPPLSQRRRPREVPERFLIALSFSGMERKFVRAIAEAVEHRLGASSVFFDEWFAFYIGGHDADLKLQRIYDTECELVVVCVSASYGSKAWTRAEHEAIRARLMRARDPRQRDRVFLIRVGDGDAEGIPSNAIAPDVRGWTPERVADLIEDRLQYCQGRDPEKSKSSVIEGESTGNSAKPSRRQRIGMVAVIIALMVIAPVAVASAIGWLRDVGRSGAEQVPPPSLVPSRARPSTDVGKSTLAPVRQDEAPALVTPNAKDAQDGGTPVRASGHPPVQKLVPESRVPHRSAVEQRAPSRAFRQPPAIEEPRYALAPRGPATPPEVSADEIGKRQVRRAVLNNVDLLRRCYEDQLQINPYLEGEVQVSFVISGEGRVVSSNAKGLGDAVDYCVAGEIASISFSPLPDGSGAVVDYPLLFRLARKSPMLQLGAPTVLQPPIKRHGT